MSGPIQIIDRKSGKLFEEKIFGEKFVLWAHKSSLGLILTSNRWIQKIVSGAYGFYASTLFSRREIKPFIREHNIQMQDFEIPEGGYRSFNDFFSRKLKKGKRSFEQKSSQVVLAPAEGRVYYHAINQRGETSLFVKGNSYTVRELIGEETDGLGHAFVIRLCPVDYHRYHFGFSGAVLDSKKLGGCLFSVNPIALQKNHRIFWENYREVFKLISDEQKIIYQLEVGAICVGSMTQNKKKGDVFYCGEEKGTFLFGGSTCILLLPKEFKPSSDIVENSRKGFETLLQVGSELGSF